MEREETNVILLGSAGGVEGRDSAPALSQDVWEKPGPGGDTW